jgi:hypothetical protein
VGELLAAAERRTEERQRQEAEREAAEKARREREEAAARARYLDGLIGQESDLWRRVEALIDTKRQNDYDQAVDLLVDLRDLAVRSSGEAEFETHLRQLRQRHAAKPSLRARLDKAGLAAGWPPK